MSAYAHLRNFLAGQELDEVPLTFAEIEKIIGRALPASAYKYAEWWANQVAGRTQSRAWMGAGFRSEQIDLLARRLIFRRAPSPAYTPASPDAVASVADASAAYAVRGRHPIFGALKGAITTAPGTDLTAPADPDWGAAG